jgi:hypothetical protein
MLKYIKLFFLLSFVVLQGQILAQQENPEAFLWYDEPAESWQHEALPIGSGCIGAMILDRISPKRLYANAHV